MGEAGSAVGQSTMSSDGSGGTNNLPPILFHQVHGDNIRISREGTVATRAESFWMGVTFSNRPINVAEKVYVKFLEVSNKWSGVIHFGFTCYDPNNLRYCLPESAYQGLTDKPGYWVKALDQRFAEQDTVLFYYVTQAGDVHFGINGEEKGEFFSGVETRGPLWAIIDVYGMSTAIELVDPRQVLNNSRRNLAIEVDTSHGDSAATELLILPSLPALTMNQQNHQPPQSQRSATDDATTNDMLGSRFQQPGKFFSPLSFHTTHGRNIQLSNCRYIANRRDTELCNGYVFTARPIQLGQKVVIQVLATEPKYIGELAFGLTSCDPAMIQGADLPDDSDLLLDRPEYWVVCKDVASCPKRGDKLSFSITHTGEVQFSKNGSTPVVFMYADQTIQLWAFFDLYGNTQKVRIFGSCVEPHHPHTSSGSRNSSPSPTVIDPALAAGHLRVNLPCSVINQSPPTAETTQHHLQSSQLSVPVELQPSSSGTLLSTYSHTYIEPVSPTSCFTLNSTVTTQQCVDATAATGGSGTECTVCCERPIVINQRPPPVVTTQNHRESPQTSGPVDLQPSSSGTLISTYSHTNIEAANYSSTLHSTVTEKQSIDATAATRVSGKKCTICCERPCDSAFYTCGHMFMCYECAFQQWRGMGGGHCPICRAVIRDVIRAYKS